MRRWLLSVLLVAGCPHAGPSHGGAVVERRVIISETRPSGTSVTTIAADGTITVAFDEVENGRGPHTDATIRLAADGTVESFTANGHHEMGTPVDETFTIEGGHADWQSHEEHGGADLRAPAFYIPSADLPDASGMLV